MLVLGAVVAAAITFAIAAGRSDVDPSRPVQEPARDGDIDGDGTVDEVTLADDGDRWRLELTLSTLGSRRTTFEAVGGAPPAIAGVVDADADGFSEVFVRVGSGASTALGSLFRLVGDRIESVNFEKEGSTFGVGGSVGHLEGLQCRDSFPDQPGHEIERTYAQPADDSGDVYDVAISSYRFDGAALRFVNERIERLPAAGVPGVDCGTLATEDW